MKDTIVSIILIVIAVLFAVLCVIAHQRNQEYNRQMKENAEKFHDEAVNARQEDLKAGKEFQEKYYKKFWSDTKGSDSQE